MPDLPISGLPAITVPSNSYLLAAVSASVTSQMTVKQVGDAYSSSLSGNFVPYTGATSNVDLGSNRTLRGGYLSASAMDVNDSFRINGNGSTQGGTLQFKQYSSIVSGWENKTTIGAVYDDRVLITFYQTGSTNYKTVNLLSTLVPDDSSVSLNFPSSSGTLALKSDTFPYTGSARITGSLDLTGSLNVTGSISQTNVLNSLVKANSNGTLVAATSGADYIAPAYLSAYHTASLPVYTVNTPTTMSFSTVDFSFGGITLSGSYHDKIKVANGGIYNIQFSAQATKSTGTTSKLNIWLAKNGTEVPDSNTGVHLAGGANDIATPAWNFFVSASAGDYYQLMFAATNTNTFIQYAASGSALIAAGPAEPSLLLTVNRIA